jgi:hypothetical protein
MEPIHSLHVSSQIQNYAALPIQNIPMLLDNKTIYTLKPDALPYFINSAEWNLGRILFEAYFLEVDLTYESSCCFCIATD